MRERVTLRGAVLVLFAASMVYALTFVAPISRTLADVVGVLSSDVRVMGAWLAAGVAVLVGHALRAWRDTLLFSRAAKTTVRTQFGAFAVGQLCSAVLPLKLGEFVRADVIAQRYRISYSFTFALVCLERLVDALALFLLALAFVGFYPPLAVIAVALFVVVWVLWRSPSWFKRMVTRLGSVLDDGVEARFLFVFWSLEYGLKRTLRPEVLIPYLALAIANWTFYVAAFVPVLLFASQVGVWESVSGSVGSYVALTTALTPASLGSYSGTLASFGMSDPAVYILLWIAAVVPVSAAGALYAAVKLRDVPLLRPRVVGKSAVLDNKLSRNADISEDQLGFLKDYYSDSGLARKVAQDEIGGGPVVNRFFTNGGSGAVTYLSHVDGETRVTKLVSQGKSGALRQQYAWLRSHECPLVVRAYAEHDEAETYSIDIDFEEGSVDFFEWAHSVSPSERRLFIDSVVEAMAREVWGTAEADAALVDGAEARVRVEAYLDKHIAQSLALAAEAMPSLERLIAADEIVVNGEACPNVMALLERVRREDVMGDLCLYHRADAIHGDFIGDNLMWSPAKGHPVILDPVPEGNFLDGAVFDFGKLSQSLQIGYEFMLRDVSDVYVRWEGNCAHIDYADMRSAAYEEMWRHVADELAPQYLSESERRTMLFLGATNYLRRMKHQAVQCPANAPKFYAAGILYLSRYVGLFG